MSLHLRQVHLVVDMGALPVGSVSFFRPIFVANNVLWVQPRPHLLPFSSPVSGLPPAF